MQSEWHPSEATLILKAMFLMLSDDFRVAAAAQTFLKEFAAMGRPFNQLDYPHAIETFAHEYHGQPGVFMQKLLADLAAPTLDERVALRLLSLSISVLEENEKTYERLTVLKSLRAQCRVDAARIPDYAPFQSTPLSLEVLSQFLERDMLDDATLFRISNEHNPGPETAGAGTGDTTGARCAPKTIEKWWRTLFGNRPS